MVRTPADSARGLRRRYQLLFHHGRHALAAVPTHARRGIEQLHRLAAVSARRHSSSRLSVIPTQPEFCYAPFLEVLDEMPRPAAALMSRVMGGVYASDFMSRLEIYRDHLRDAACRLSAALARPFTTGSRRDRRCRSTPSDSPLRATTRSIPARARISFPFRPAAGRTRLFNFNSTVGVVSGVDASRRLASAPITGSPTPTDYYRFALSRPEVDGLLCAPQTPEQITALAARARRRPARPRGGKLSDQSRRTGRRRSRHARPRRTVKRLLMC